MHPEGIFGLHQRHSGYSVNAYLMKYLEKLRGSMKKTTQLSTMTLNAVQVVGHSIFELLSFNGRFTLFCWRMTKTTLSPPWRWSHFIQQCISIGVKSFPIAALTSVFVGMVMVLQTGVQLTKFGSKTYVPGISFIANAREMVPAFCAMVVGARVAASITAEIGTMKVTEQLDAMDILNVDPVRYLGQPRLIAMTLMLPLISAVCLVTGYLGGMAVGHAALSIDSHAYYNTTLKFALVSDVYGGLIKTVVFGMIIAYTGCFYGFNTGGGAAGVGRATTNSVVLTMILILIFDYLLTSVILAIIGM